MVSKLLCISDLHFRNYKRLDEYKEQFQKLIDEFKTKTDLFSPKKTRILLLGDIVDSKTSISPECNLQVGWLLNELNKIAKTIVICGNHDVGNLERMDSITPIFALSNFTNSLYLDKELSYHSGCFVDENIVWCLYSIFDGFQRPNIDEMKIKYPDKTFIGLIHGDVIGAKTDLGRKVDTGLGVSNFDGLDYVLCGHIHKYQNINKSGIPILYCGSTLQNNFGENINGHGFVIVDIENKNHELIEIPSDYGYYKFVINSELDIENDLEKLTNF